MAVTFVSSSSYNNGSGSTSVIIPKPASLADNDVLFAWIIVADSASLISAPSGWTQVRYHNDTTDDHSTGLFYKAIPAATSEPTDYTWTVTSERAGGVITAYRGVDNADPIINHAAYDITSTSYPFPNISNYLYNPPYSPAIFFGANSDSTTHAYTYSGGSYPITERVETTSSGGGPGTGKITISAADALPAQTASNMLNGAAYSFDPGASIRRTQIIVALRDASAPIPGEAISFTGSGALSEIRTQPVQWTAGKQTARVSSVGGESPHISNPDAAYELFGQNKRMVGIYAEYDSGVYPREQEGHAVTFSPESEDYSRWFENDSDYTWQGQYYGSATIDTARIDDNRFVVLYSYGHAADFYNPPEQNAYWVSGADARILRVDGTTVTIESSAGMAPDNSYLGNVVTDGQNSVIYSGVINTTTPSYGARIWHYNGSTWALGTQHSYASDGRSATYSTAAAHIPEQKAVFFYSDSTLGAYVARVGNITNDVNARPTVITYGTEYAVPNTTASSAYAATTKPIVLSETEGLILLKQTTNSGLDFNLIKYTIGVGDVITFDSPITITTDVGGSHSKQGTTAMMLFRGRIVIAYTSYKNTSPYYTARIATLQYDSGTGTITPDTDDELFPLSATYRVSNPTLSPGSGPYYHLNYFDWSTSGRLPVLQTFSIPITEVETDETNNLAAYISIADPNPINHTQEALCFINTEGDYSTQGAFIAAPATPVNNIPEQDIFIWGWKEQESTALAYINYTPPIEGDVTCFIHAGAESSDISAYVSGPNIADNLSVDLFVSGINLSSVTQACFIEGLAVIGQINTIGAIHLDKSLSQRIEFSDHLDIRPTTEVTVNFWMKAYDVSDGSRPGFLIKDYGSSRSIGIFEGATGTQKWHYGIDTTTGWSAQDTTGNYVANQWYMVTLRYDGAFCSFFINGMKDGEFAKTGDIRWDGGTWNVGYRPNTGEYANMTFADFDLWNYALTDQEIEELFAYKSEKGVGCYMEGGTFEVLEKSVFNYIVSDTSPTNPGVATTSVTLDFADQGINAYQSIYLVGSTIEEHTHDFQITIDNFREHNFDLVLRINGQGEGVLTKLLGEIEYPIQRDSTIFLDNVYFQDMPGKQYTNVLSYLHAGFFADSSRKAFISGPIYAHDVQPAFINADVWSEDGLQRCFIVNENATVSQSAYIQIGTPTARELNVFAFISYEVDVAESGTTAYIYGQDEMDASAQKAFIQVGSIAQGFRQAYIHCDEVDSTSAPLQKAHIVASALAYDPPQNCFVFGVWVEEGSQAAFVHCQPTAEKSVGCFIIAPTPALPDLPMSPFIYGNQPTYVSQLAHIHAALNLTSDQNAYMYGKDFRESSRRAYIVNVIIYNATNKGPRGYINSAWEQESSQNCFITGQGELYSTVDARLVDDDGPQPKEKFKKCFIVGEAISSIPSLGAFILGGIPTTGDEGNDLFIYIEGS